jgi:PHD/YefM family antitoxin component YafN of YafNO toxin-antitoxin module
MKTKSKRRQQEALLRGGKPAAVILDIEEYREILERLEEREDLMTLKKMRAKPLKFRRLDDFIKERNARV